MTYIEQLKQLCRKHKTFILLVAIAITLTLGIWLAVSPTIENQKMLAHQNELLACIERGDGVIVLDDRFVSEDVDFYDDDPLDDAEITIAPSEAATPMQETTTVKGIGVLTIEKIGLKLPVTDGVSSAQLKVAVGWVPQTTPIGERGNAVIAGHRSYTYGQFFNRLDEMAIGDIIQYQGRDGNMLKFEAYDILEVLPGDPAVFEETIGESRLTLLTCTPVRVASHRLLIQARLVSKGELDVKRRE